MKPIIIIDNHIPHIKGVLDDVARIYYVPSADITHETIKTLHADALIIRTRTHCDASTLDGTNVGFIATATIGTDHIDTEYCTQHGIRWQNAPGCNARSVAQYIGAALAVYAQKHNITLHKKTTGIVGHGHVGTEVEKLCNQLGMDVLLCDPPKAKTTDIGYVSLETIAENADIITIHTPLSKEGDYPTYHLFNHDIICQTKRHPLLINAARGGVIDEASVLFALDNKIISDVIIDCWENEPNINRCLLQKSLLSTPHIAGYSADGKLNATTQAVAATCRYFGIKANRIPTLPPKACANAQGEQLAKLLLQNYNITADSEALKAMPSDFEKLRNNYYVRREIDIFN